MQPAPREQRPSVLLVDDEEELVSRLAAGLRLKGYDAVWTSKPKVALRLAAQKRFEVAILDLVMPRIWGIELARSLRRVDPAIQCIILTGHANIDRCRKAFRAGIADFLMKPSTLDEVSKAINHLLEPHEDSMTLRDLLRVLGRGSDPCPDGADLTELLSNPLAYELDEFKERMVRHYLCQAARLCEGVPKTIASVVGCSLATTYRLLTRFDVPYDRQLPASKRRPASTTAGRKSARARRTG